MKNNELGSVAKYQRWFLAVLPSIFIAGGASYYNELSGTIISKLALWGSLVLVMYVFVKLLQSLVEINEKAVSKLDKFLDE